MAVDITSTITATLNTVFGNVNQYPTLSEATINDFAFAVTLDDDDFYLNPDNISNLTYPLFDYISVSLYLHTDEACKANLAARSILETLNLSERVDYSASVN